MLPILISHGLLIVFCLLIFSLCAISLDDASYSLLHVCEQLTNGPRGRRKDQEFMILSMTPSRSYPNRMLVANSAGNGSTSRSMQTVESIESWALKGVKGTSSGDVPAASTLAHEVPRKSNHFATKARADMAFHMRESPVLERSQGS